MAGEGIHPLRTSFHQFGPKRFIHCSSRHPTVSSTHPTRTLTLPSPCISLPPRRHLLSPPPSPLFFFRRFIGGSGGRHRLPHTPPRTYLPQPFSLPLFLGDPVAGRPAEMTAGPGARAARQPSREQLPTAVMGLQHEGRLEVRGSNAR
jgi:hypothetical protein